MNNVKYSFENETLTILLRGHIDSANAQEVESAIDEARAANPAKSVIVDCRDLTYTSSAGLRVILRLKKSRPRYEADKRQL